MRVGVDKKQRVLVHMGMEQSGLLGQLCLSDVGGGAGGYAGLCAAGRLAAQHRSLSLT